MTARELRPDALTGTGAILIAAGYLFGIYWPNQVRIERAEQQLAAALQGIRAIPERARQAEQLRLDARAARDYVNSARPKKVADLRTSDIVELTSTLAGTAGVTVNTLQPHPSLAWDRHREWPVDVACEGDARAVAAFVAALESSTRRIAIHRVSMTSREEGRPIQADIRFSVHSDPAEFAGSADFDSSLDSEPADP